MLMETMSQEPEIAPLLSMPRNEASDSENELLSGRPVTASVPERTGAPAAAAARSQAFMALSSVPSSIWQPVLVSAGSRYSARILPQILLAASSAEIPLTAA